jgi:hypothetical protein
VPHKTVSKLPVHLLILDLLENLKHENEVVGKEEAQQAKAARIPSKLKAGLSLWRTECDW